MGLSATQRFLLEASRVAASDGYFDRRAVASALGYSAGESDVAIESLGARKLIVGLADGHARLLDAGRRFALQLEQKLARSGKP